MKGLLLLLALLTFGVATATTPQAVVADEGHSHDGTVVSTAPGKLTMKDEGGKEHSHDIGAAVKITVNGRPGKLDDLKSGMKIRVTTDKEGMVLTLATIDSEK